MSIFQRIWIIAWVLLAYLAYGDSALYIALAGHLGIRAGAFVLQRIIGRITGLLVLCAAFYLMYLSVHLCGWGCFWLLFFSYVWVKMTYYPSGHAKSIEFPIGSW